MFDLLELFSTTFLLFAINALIFILAGILKAWNKKAFALLVMIGIIICLFLMIYTLINHIEPNLPLEKTIGIIIGWSIPSFIHPVLMEMGEDFYTHYLK